MVEQSKIKEILTNYRTVAVIGLSRDSNKDSYMVSSYLQDNGFKIIPVNPFAHKILGERSYGNLLEIPVELQKTIEIVNIFRPSNDVPGIVEETIRLREIHGLPYVIWMQLGIINDIAAQKAINSGLQVVMNRCMMVEHSKLFQETG
jgi:predicted CoA-binding protein